MTPADIRFEIDSDGDYSICDYATTPPRFCGWLQRPVAGDAWGCALTGGRGRDFPPTEAGLEAAKAWARDTLMGVKEAA